MIGVEGLEIQRVAALETATGEFRQITPAALHVYEYDWAPDSGSSPTWPHLRPEKTTGGWRKLYTQTLGGGPPDSLLDPEHTHRPAARFADRRAPLVSGGRPDRASSAA